MPKTVVLDELHLTVRIPASLPDTEADAARRTLTSREFMVLLDANVRAAFGAFPELAFARVLVTR